MPRIRTKSFLEKPPYNTGVLSIGPNVSIAPAKPAKGQPCTETITWHPVPGHERPDDEMTVLVTIVEMGETMVCTGHKEGNAWWTDAMRKIKVIAWAELPEGMPLEKGK